MNARKRRDFNRYSTKKCPWCRAKAVKWLVKTGITCLCCGWTEER